MGQPTPPGDMPLIEGLGPEWNEIVSGFPEDKRAELGPKIRERLSTYETTQQAYEPWKNLQDSGITPELASTAATLYRLIENDPRQVYETIGKHLGITPQQAKEVVQEAKEDKEDEDPRFAKLSTLEQQVQVMSQILLGQRDMEAQEKAKAEADAALDKELKSLKTKYSDVDEEQVIMYMLQHNVAAEEAYKMYTERDNNIRSRRPAPFVLGSGGHIPTNKPIDPKTLSPADTKNLVAQMMQQGTNEAK